jgi:hypothetical protein
VKSVIQVNLDRCSFMESFSGADLNILDRLCINRRGNANEFSTERTAQGLVVGIGTSKIPLLKRRHLKAPSVWFDTPSVSKQNGASGH